MWWCVLLLAQDFSFAPPDAAFLASLNVRQVRGMAEQWAREAGIKSPVSWKVLDRVERVQVAIAMRDGEPQLIAMLEGEFREADVAELTKSAAANDGMQVKMLDAHRILISDRGVLRGLPALRVPKPQALRPRETGPKVMVVHGMAGGRKEIPIE